MKAPRLLALLVATAVSLSATDKNFDAWADNLTAETMRANPTGATATQFFSGAEQDALDRQLTPITKAHRAAHVAAAQKALAELAQFDRARLDPEQRISASVIEWSLRGVVDSEPFADFSFVFSQFGGCR
jgi:uncharacterized protein (DUF885 family)